MDPLVPVVQTYAWGSVDAIANLRGVEPTGEPQAELWFGTHPNGPARIERGGAEPLLADVIAADPAGELGPVVVERFGARLPFLAKVLAAARPLSLQVHPTQEQAAAGHAREEQQGIARDAPHRTYRDTSHKPELLCALTPFEALCGFRSIERTLALLDDLAVPELAAAAGAIRERGAAALTPVVTALLEQPPTTSAPMVRSLGLRAGTLEATDPVLAWVRRLAAAHPDDPGVAVALLLNHVHLGPGEAVHLPAGHLHAYLQGTGVEVMAASDNVVRGGLTTKHVDIPELARVLDPRPVEVRPMRPRPVDGVESVYDTPDDEFIVSRLDLPPGTAVDRQTAGGEVLLCVEGGARVSGRALPCGHGLWVPARTGRYDVAAGARDAPSATGAGDATSATRALVYRVRVGVVA
ncbi:MAG: mannose-6-phosphate isomerase, class I [Actinobacteria bacterium]|nr:mannose-6-phosphate isomerase, class I [Actinomycetota bacterium]